MMDPEDLLHELLLPVHEFCRTLDVQPPAYSYIPLQTDEQRIRVMQSRLFNELRAADLFGTWLKTTPELDVKATMAESAHEEMNHAQLLSKRIRDLGSDPFDYKPLPAQIAMFNAMEGLNETCERVAGLSLAGETVAAAAAVEGAIAASLAASVSSSDRDSASRNDSAAFASEATSGAITRATRAGLRSAMNRSTTMATTPTAEAASARSK